MITEIELISDLKYVLDIFVGVKCVPKLLVKESIPNNYRDGFIFLVRHFGFLVLIIFQMCDIRISYVKMQKL